MKDIIGNVAQELADHLDDLRGDEGVVPNFDGGDDFPVTEVGDAEKDKGLSQVFRPSASFVATVGGQELRVTVSEA